MEYACGDHNAADGNPKPQILPWDPEVAAHQGPYLSAVPLHPVTVVGRANDQSIMISHAIRFVSIDSFFIVDVGADFPITTYQPIYFLAESLEDAKEKMRRYCEDLPRPFFAQHNPQTDTIYIDRPVKRTKGIPTNMPENL
jgi:hypothetical protein